MESDDFDDVMEAYFAYQATQIKLLNGPQELLCECFCVSTKEVKEFIQDYGNGPPSLQDVVHKFSLGKGCGSCSSSSLKRIKEIIKEHEF